MKLIRSSHEIVPQAPGIEGMYKQVELAARNCYQSFDKMTENSHEKLLAHLGSNGHMSPFAHGTVYLKFPINSGGMLYNRIKEYDANFWSKVVIENGATHGVPSDAGYYVTTNMRVLKENGWEDDLKYWCEPTEFHPKRTTIKVVCSIGISRELNRHSTVLAIAESSTRYCNYSKDKFGAQVTFVIPSTMVNLAPDYQGFGYENITHEELVFLDTIKNSERAYLVMIKNGSKPQVARDVLPLSTATTVFYTGFDSDWKEVFKKRTTPACHPDMIALMKPIEEKFNELNLL